MSNPSVTASIGVNDQASPKLRELMQLSLKLSRVTKDLGGQGGDRYANSLRAATVAAREHLSVMERLHKVQFAVAGTVAGLATAKAMHVAAHMVKDYIPYERDVRYQRAIQGYSGSDMALLERQRVDASVRFGLKPEDTLHAQQAFVTRNFSAAITEAGTQQAIVLSKALNVQAEQAAKIVEGITFGTGTHLHNAADARREIARYTDIAALAAKAGAMSPEDISQFAKYGIGMASAANISPQQAYAVGMTLKRANVGGDESGVFMRQLSARLLAPTSKAFDAFAHMDIDYSKYATQGSVSPDAIDATLRRKQGKGLSEAGKENLRDAFNDDSRNVLGNREEFAAAVREAIERGGEKLSRTDLKNTVKAALTQYDLAKGGLRGGDLLNDILSKASPKDLQALVGDKQGGRAVMLLNALEQYREYLEKLGHSDGYANKIANERLEGLAAATDRLTASLDMASKQIVKANEGWLTPLAEAGAKLAGFTAKLDETSRVAISVGAGVAGLAGLSAATGTVLSVIASMGSLATSANLAATSLARIAAGGAVGAAGTAVGSIAGGVAAGGAVATGARVATGLALGIARAYPWLLAGYATYEGANYLRDRFGGGWSGANTQSAARRSNDSLVNFLAAYGPPKGPSSARSLGLAADQIATGANLALESGRFAILDSGKADGAKWGDGYTLSERRASSLRALGLTDEQVTGRTNSSVAPSNAQSGNAIAEVTGTVTGSAEVHTNIAVSITPTPWFEGLVRRAEAVANMGINGKLGTGLQGPGDNSVKPVAAPTGVQ